MSIAAVAFGGDVSAGEPLRVGVIGTSWWADAMYLPALSGGDGIEVTAVAGRDAGRTRAFADRWQIPHTFTDPEAMLTPELIDAVVIATINDSHHPLALAALEQGLHVLCEKPLALTLPQAEEMARRADEAGVTTLVPFTYRYTPSARYLKELIDGGYLGRLYHAHLRYYAGFGRDGAYSWRFDRRLAGSGAVGDIGAHFLHLAEWLFGEITDLCADLAGQVSRPERDPNGAPYEVLDDSALLLLRFAGGAQGVLHASTLAHEETPFGQRHEIDAHGSGGTLRQRIDWDRRQEVWGHRPGEGPQQRLDIPDRIWGTARREVVTETYKDLFRLEGRMVREFAEAARSGRRLRPDFGDGLRVQRLIDAAQRSALERRWVAVEESAP
jgi:predicted dehydrogenase